MKKVKYLLLLCLFALITTGCVKFNANMSINKDKSMEFSIIYAFDKSLMGEGNTLKEEDMAEPKKCGYEITKYSEGNYEGFKLVKKVANIDEVSSETDVTYDLSGMMDEGVCDGKMFKVVKGTDKNTYTAKFKFSTDTSSLTGGEDENEETETPDEDITLTSEDSDDISSALTGGDDMDLSALMANLDLSFSVDLPYGALNSNATSKENDNKKLTWKLGASEEQTLEFTFELKNNDGGNMMLYIGIGAAVLVALIVVGIIISKKNKGVPEVVSNDYSAPVEEVKTDYFEAPRETVVTEPTESVVPETDNKEE